MRIGKGKQLHIYVLHRIRWRAEDLTRFEKSPEFACGKNLELLDRILQQIPFEPFELSMQTFLHHHHQQ
jgi:hypothetical protein